MNHLVPEFDMDVDYSIPPCSGLPKPKNMQEDDILELRWQNGQVIVQNQRKSSPPATKFPPPPPEDELMSWLEYPIDREFHSLFYLPPPPRFQEPSISFENKEKRESMVDSSDTPAFRGLRGAVENSIMSASRDVNTFDLTLTTSSPSRRGGSFTADVITLPLSDDRKRKGREPLEESNTDYHSEDLDSESYEPRKQTRDTNTRRSRAAEVHNLSERRRRGRINKKMKTLQELIPQCSKTDKASMLDEAIEYLKSLQMQVQVMSMGYGMVPMMLPGVQQYLSSLGMGMDMGMSQQIMPFPGVLSNSTNPPSQLDPRFPLQSFQTSFIPGNDPSGIQQASNQGEFNMARISNFNIQQMQMQIAQNQLTLNQERASQVQTEAKTMKTF